MAWYSSLIDHLDQNITEFLLLTSYLAASQISPTVDNIFDITSGNHFDYHSSLHLRHHIFTTILIDHLGHYNQLKIIIYIIFGLDILDIMFDNILDFINKPFLISFLIAF